MMDVAGWMTTILAIVGVVLNNRMDRRCFVFWVFSNATSCVLHAAVGMWPLMVRDVVFLVLAVDGYRKWSVKKQRENHEDIKRHEGNEIRRVGCAHGVLIK